MYKNYFKIAWRNISKNKLFSIINITQRNIRAIFEIQHRCTATFAGGGFGAGASFGENNLFTTVKITKTAD